jgi:hypothetical protein
MCGSGCEVVYVGELVTVVGQPLEEQAQGYVVAYGVQVCWGMFRHLMWAVVGVGVVCTCVCMFVGVGAGVCACSVGWGVGGAWECAGVGVPRCLSVECRGLSNERAVRSHGAVCLT